MGSGHSYLQNQAVVDSGEGLVYFQDLFSIAGPGGLKFSTLQNMPSMSMSVNGLQNQMSGSFGGVSFSTLQNMPSMSMSVNGLQNLDVVDTGNGLVFY